MVIDYAGQRQPTRRGLVALILSAAAMGPALLALLLGMSGRHLDPFAMIIMLPLWICSLTLGVVGTMSLVDSGRSRRTSGSDLQRPATLVNIVFWTVLGASVLLPLMR